MIFSDLPTKIKEEAAILDWGEKDADLSTTILFFKERKTVELTCLNVACFAYQ